MFGLLKEALGGKKFRLDEEVHQTTHDWLHSQSKEFFLFPQEFKHFVKHWKNCIERGRDYVEK
jgi:hypothetical protein